MSKFLIDTDILSMFLRNNENVKLNFSKFINETQKITFSCLTYYEILSGLKFRDNKKFMSRFTELSSFSDIIPLSLDAIEKSSVIYAELRNEGIIIDDVDILNAGICLSHNLVLITNNIKHFEKIDGLNISNWSLV